MKDTIYRADAIEAVASRDETDGTVKVFTGRQVNEILSALPSAEAVQVAYICDGRRCKSDCGECFRTLDIEHARDFKLMGDTFFQQPSAEWIPCSERLPEKTDMYLVTYGNTHGGKVEQMVYPLHYWQKRWMSFDHSWESKTVTAWMPLPTPYKGGDSE